MSLGGGSQKQSSSSTPVLYGPERIMRPAQQVYWGGRPYGELTGGSAAKSILDQALAGGYSPSEKASLYRRTAENINATTRGTMEGLKEQYAKAGLTGGVQGRDMSDILEASIGAKAKAWGDVEQASRDEADRRWQRLLQLMTWHAPALTSQSSTSSSKGWDASVGLPW